MTTPYGPRPGIEPACVQTPLRPDTWAFLAHPPDRSTLVYRVTSSARPGWAVELHRWADGQERRIEYVDEIAQVNSDDECAWCHAPVTDDAWDSAGECHAEPCAGERATWRSEQAIDNRADAE